jgi:Tfp pilus assembly protein FimT
MTSLRKKGFTLVEALLVLMFLAALTAIAVPRMNFGFVDSTTADTQARKITTALRRTRRMAISDAAQNKSGYALKISDDSYQIINLKNSQTVDTKQIEGNLSITGSDEFRFGYMGNLLNPSNNELTVSSSEKSFTVTVIPATGMVKCSEME